MPESQQAERAHRIVAVVSDASVVGPAAARALTDLAGQRRLDLPVHPREAEVTDEYLEVIRRGVRFLDSVAPADSMSVVAVDSLAALPSAIRGLVADARAVLSLLVIDHSAYRYNALCADELNEQLTELGTSLADYVDFEPGPYTVQVYTEPDIESTYSVERFAPRWMPHEPWVVAGDIACAFVDSVQMHCNRRLLPDMQPSSIAEAVADFLTAEAGSQWGLSYYTGSGVATFIDGIERRAIANGNPIVRGPSEHSLACSALARWRLDGAPFVIVATSGMHDEFRGTLANHVSARTRGFIVCADSRQDQWHPFQGTVHRTADSRPSLAARGFPVVYIGRSDEIEDGLAEAFSAYSSGRGPVMIIAPREVLQANVALRQAAGPAEAPRVSLSDAASVAVDELVQLLNSERRRLLCQVGPLPGAARDSLYALARGAGIALADSVAQPGTVSRYSNGRRVDEFIGTLSMYGYSARVYEYLHSEGELRPPASQAVMFVGTAIPQIDTPFSTSALRRLAPIQIIDREIDRAPFTGLAVVGDIGAVLGELHARLDVAPDVLDFRRAAIASTHDSDGDVIGLLPIMPMTTNHFFRRLRDVLDRLIVEQDYRYVGVYDIGRAGLSAVNSLPRTGTGVSGWFGRGLMGDGVMSLPGVVTRRAENVISFTGDAAVAMAPDIVPTLVQQIAVDRSDFERTLTIFRFVNGSHSLIRTYREGVQPSAVSAQTGTLTFTPPDYDRSVGSLSIRHRRIMQFGDVPLEQQLQEPRTINLYSVVVGHNNEGDGLSRFSSLGWQRDELSPKALEVAGVLAPAAVMAG